MQCRRCAVIEKWREIHQGDIFDANIPALRHGSIQAGFRPVIVVSANWINKTSDVFTVAELTTSLKNPTMTVHYILPVIPGLPQRSMVLGEATARLIRDDLIRYRCTVPEDIYKNVDRAVRCGMRGRSRHKNRKQSRQSEKNNKKNRKKKKKQ